jgi:hypothetical protein
MPSPDLADPGPGSGLPTAADLFGKVATILQANCATCHQTGGQGPGFLGAGPAQYYSKLVIDARFVNAIPAQSELITQGAHEGPALTSVQATAVLAWLTQETVERPGLPQPPPPANEPSKKLAQFGNCMTLGDFTNTGMDDLQNQDTVGNAGSCWSCHSTGLYVYLSNDPTANFQRLQKSPWILKFADASVDQHGMFQDIVATNRFRDRGTEAGHPQYNLTGARLSALQQFFTLTYNRWKAGGCSVPQSTSPPDGGADM